MTTLGRTTDDEVFRDISVCSDWTTPPAGESPDTAGGLALTSTADTVLGRHDITDVTARHESIATLDPSQLLGGFALRILDRYSTTDLTFRVEQTAEEPAESAPEQHPDPEQLLDEETHEDIVEGRPLTYLAEWEHESERTRWQGDTGGAVDSPERVETRSVDERSDTGDESAPLSGDPSATEQASPQAQSHESTDTQRPQQPESTGDAAIESTDARDGVTQPATTAETGDSPETGDFPETGHSSDTGRSPETGRSPTTGEQASQTAQSSTRSRSVAVPWRPRTAATTQRLGMERLDTGAVVRTTRSVPASVTRQAPTRLGTRTGSRSSGARTVLSERESDSSEPATDTRHQQADVTRPPDDSLVGDSAESADSATGDWQEPVTDQRNPAVSNQSGRTTPGEGGQPLSDRRQRGTGRDEAVRGVTDTTEQTRRSERTANRAVGTETPDPMPDQKSGIPSPAESADRTGFSAVSRTQTTPSNGAARRTDPRSQKGPTLQDRSTLSVLLSDSPAGDPQWPAEPTGASVEQTADGRTGVTHEDGPVGSSADPHQRVASRPAAGDVSSQTAHSDSESTPGARSTDSRSTRPTSTIESSAGETTQPSGSTRSTERSDVAVTGPSDTNAAPAVRKSSPSVESTVRESSLSVDSPRGQASRPIGTGTSLGVEAPSVLSLQAGGGAADARQRRSSRPAEVSPSPQSGVTGPRLSYSERGAQQTPTETKSADHEATTWSILRETSVSTPSGGPRRATSTPETAGTAGTSRLQTGAVPVGDSPTRSVLDGQTQGASTRSETTTHVGETPLQHEDGSGVAFSRSDDSRAAVTQTSAQRTTRPEDSQHSGPTTTGSPVVNSDGVRSGDRSLDASSPATVRSGPGTPTESHSAALLNRWTTDSTTGVQSRTDRESFGDADSGQAHEPPITAASETPGGESQPVGRPAVSNSDGQVHTTAGVTHDTASSRPGALSLRTADSPVVSQTASAAVRARHRSQGSRRDASGGLGRHTGSTATDQSTAVPSPTAEQSSARQSTRRVVADSPSPATADTHAESTRPAVSDSTALSGLTETPDRTGAGWTQTFTTSESTRSDTSASQTGTSAVGRPAPTRQPPVSAADTVTGPDTDTSRSSTESTNSITRQQGAALSAVDPDLTSHAVSMRTLTSLTESTAGGRSRPSSMPETDSTADTRSTAVSRTVATRHTGTGPDGDGSDAGGAVSVARPGVSQQSVPRPGGTAVPEGARRTVSTAPELSGTTDDSLAGERRRDESDRPAVSPPASSRIGPLAASEESTSQRSTLPDTLPVTRQAAPAGLTGGDQPTRQSDSVADTSGAATDSSTVPTPTDGTVTQLARTHQSRFANRAVGASTRRGSVTGDISPETDRSGDSTRLSVRAGDASETTQSARPTEPSGPSVSQTPSVLADVDAALSHSSPAALSTTGGSSPTVDSGSDSGASPGTLQSGNETPPGGQSGDTHLTAPPSESTPVRHDSPGADGTDSPSPASADAPSHLSQTPSPSSEQSSPSHLGGQPTSTALASTVLQRQQKSPSSGPDSDGIGRLSSRSAATTPDGDTTTGVTPDPTVSRSSAASSSSDTTQTGSRRGATGFTHRQEGTSSGSETAQGQGGDTPATGVTQDSALSATETAASATERAHPTQTTGVTSQTTPASDMTARMDKYKTRTRESETDQTTATTTESSDGRPSFVYRSPLPTGATGGDGQQADATDQQSSQVAAAHQSGRGRLADQQQSVQRSPDARRQRRPEQTGMRTDTPAKSTARRSQRPADEMGSTPRPTASGSDTPTEQSNRPQRPADSLDDGPPTGGRQRSPGRDTGPDVSRQQSPAGGHTRHSEQASGSSDRHRRRSRSRTTSGEMPLPEESLEYEADVDRVVERLHRKLQRRKRIERERKGQQ